MTFAERFVIESAAIEDQRIPLDRVNESEHMKAYRAAISLADCGNPELQGFAADLDQADLRNWQALITSEQHEWPLISYPQAKAHFLQEDAVGKYREWNIGLTGIGEIGAKWHRVQDEMNELWGHLNPAACPETKDLDPTALAAWIHHRFERIHPFGDGNGRSGRLLALYVLRRDGAKPVLFTAKDKVATYYPCFRTDDPRMMIEYFKSHQVESWE